MAQLETSVQGHAVPRFSIFKPYSQDKVESLQHCFIVRTELERNSLPVNIVAKDGFVYQAVYDCRFPENATKIRVIISFQQHTYGRFAVIRLEKK